MDKIKFKVWYDDDAFAIIREVNKSLEKYGDDDAFAIIRELNKSLEKYGLRFESGEGGDSFEEFELIEIPKD